MVASPFHIILQHKVYCFDRCMSLTSMFHTLKVSDFDVISSYLVAIQNFKHCTRHICCRVLHCTKYTLACRSLDDWSVNTVLIQSCPFQIVLTQLKVSPQCVCVCGQTGYGPDLSWQLLLEPFLCQHLSLVQQLYCSGIPSLLCI